MPVWGITYRKTARFGVEADHPLAARADAHNAFRALEESGHLEWDVEVTVDGEIPPEDISDE